MLTPMAQITCIATKTWPPICGIPPGAKVVSVEMTNHSTAISHSPLVNRKRATLTGFLRAIISPALTPASNTKTGAQKCVTQRVANS